MKHTYRATLEDGAVVLRDEAGGLIRTAAFASTADRRTCYAHIPGVGYIGGWTFPAKARPFVDIVAEINRGILYETMEDLPGGRHNRFGTRGGE